MDLVQEMRVFEIDHAPDGWPAIQMKQVSALCDEIESLRAEVERLKVVQDCPHCHSTGFLFSAFMNEETRKISHVVCGSLDGWKTVNVYATDFDAARKAGE